MREKFLFSVLFLFCAATAFAKNGVIAEFSGNVEIKRGGQTVFVPAKTGDILFSDTVVSTGFKSSALIIIGSTIITVRPLTNLSLSELIATAGTETVNVNLLAGRIRVDVKAPAGTRANMSVIAPAATASVRGTSFEFDTQKLAVLEGVVEFSDNKGRLVIVNAGFGCELNAKGRVSAAINANKEALVLPALAGFSAGLAGNSARSFSWSSGYADSADIGFSFILK